MEAPAEVLRVVRNEAQFVEIDLDAAHRPTGGIGHSLKLSSTRTQTVCASGPPSKSRSPMLSRRPAWRPKPPLKMVANDARAAPREARQGARDADKPARRRAAGRCDTFSAILEANDIHPSAVLGNGSVPGLTEEQIP